VGFVFFGIFRLRPAASSVVALEVSPSAPAVALVGRGPLPSSIVGSAVGTVSPKDGSVSCVVGSVVTGTVGMLVSAGFEFLQPHPVNKVTIKMAVRKIALYFFIFFNLQNYWFRRYYCQNSANYPGKNYHMNKPVV
jgi:hypothetical protein